MGRPSIPWTIERLVARVRVEGSCWVFTGRLDRDGYGVVDIQRLNVVRHIFTHRLMADLVGLPGDGPFIMHACHNRPCCNPEHLYRGTHAQNMLERRYAVNPEPSGYAWREEEIA
jgi:hypothetical protein